MRRGAVMVLAAALAGCAGAPSTPRPDVTPVPSDAGGATVAPEATATPEATLAPWDPSDLKPWIEADTGISNVPYRFLEKDEFSCTKSYATGCWGVLVMPRWECEFISVEMDVLNADGTVRTAGLIALSDGPVAALEKVKVVVNRSEKGDPAKARLKNIFCM